MISLLTLQDAKEYPNDAASRRLMQQRVGRAYFNTKSPEFLFKPAYDVRRESILTTNIVTGRPETVPAADVPLLNPSSMTSADPTTRGDSSAARGNKGSRAPAATPEAIEEETQEFGGEYAKETPPQDAKADEVASDPG